MSDPNLASFNFSSTQLKAIYSHCRFLEDCATKETAAEFVDMWKSVIDTLSKIHRLYVRSAPQVVENKAFGDDDSRWVASARFSIGPRLNEGESND